MPFPYPALSMVPLSRSQHGRKPSPCTELALAAQSKAKKRTVEIAAATGLESLQGHQQNHLGRRKDLKKPPDTLITVFL